MLPSGPGTPAKDKETFVKKPGGVTVGKPQGALSTSIPDANETGASPGVAIGGPKQKAQTTSVGGKSITWKPSLHASDKGMTVLHAAAAPARPALKKARSWSWEKTSNRQLD